MEGFGLTVLVIALALLCAVAARVLWSLYLYDKPFFLEGYYFKRSSVEVLRPFLLSGRYVVEITLTNGTEYYGENYYETSDECSAVIAKAITDLQTHS